MEKNGGIKGGLGRLERVFRLPYFLIPRLHLLTQAFDGREKYFQGEKTTYKMDPGAS